MATHQISLLPPYILYYTGLNLVMTKSDIVMSVVDQLDDNEKLVYHIVKRETEEHGGILQTKLKEMPELKNLRPRQITTIVNKLVKLNLIKRELVVNNGRSMYLLKAVPPISFQKDLGYAIEIVSGIPCFRCKNLYLCGEGRSFSPLKCPYLTQYLVSKS